MRLSNNKLRAPSGGKSASGWGLVPSALLLLVLVSMPEQAFAGEDSFSRGMKSYNQKDYKQAIVYFNKAAAKEPYNAELHYYLANSHIFLNNGKSAIKEYSTCFDLEPMSTFGQYSRKALLGFGKKFQGFVSSSAPDKKHVAADDARSIKQALSMIRKQACERDRLNHDAGEGAAKVAVSSGEERNRRLGRAAEQLVEDLTPINRAPSAALQQEMNEIQQSAVFAGQHARQDAQQQAAKHMSAAALRSTLVEKSASSLLALMSENPRPGHVKMKAAGTNLYVRNYEFEPEPSPEPLLATWELLPSVGLPGSAGTSQTSLHTNSSSALAGSAKNISLKGLSNAQPKPAKIAREKQAESMGSSAAPGDVLIYGQDGRVLLHVRDNGSK